MLIRSSQIAVNILICSYLNVNLSYVSVFSLGKIKYKITTNSVLSSLKAFYLGLLSLRHI